MKHKVAIVKSKEDGKYNSDLIYSEPEPNYACQVCWGSGCFIDENSRGERIYYKDENCPSCDGSGIRQ